MISNNSNNNKYINSNNNYYINNSNEVIMIKIIDIKIRAHAIQLKSGPLKWY